MTHVYFPKLLSGDFAALLMKKKLFWVVIRLEKDALVVDSADYDMVRSLEEAYRPNGE